MGVQEIINWCPAYILWVPWRYFIGVLEIFDVSLGNLIGVLQIFLVSW